MTPRSAPGSKRWSPREVYGLDAGGWQHLTGTFTCGSGDTKAELDEIIARSRELW